MIILTGAAGFIGSNILKKLNELGEKNIILVDDLQNYIKYKNIINLSYLDFINKEDFLHSFDFNKSKIKAIIHQGACSSTTELNLNYLIRNNFEYSKSLLHISIEKKIPFIYASSASVYGNSPKSFIESFQNEEPANPYAFSKYLFDNYVRNNIDFHIHRVVGLRYFNVYGPNESHKNSMASTIFHFNKQLLESGFIKLFGKYDGYDNGCQKRDFIYVDDCVNVVNWFLDNSFSGIFNVGTGISRTFNDVAENVLKWHNTGKIDYIDFPENLKGSYQSFTQADISNLRKIGYTKNFKSIEEGICLYLNQLNKKH